MNKSIREVMARNPMVVQPNTPLRDAIQLMAQNHFSGLPVVDPENPDHLVGVVSQTDFLSQETGVTPPAYMMVLDSFVYFNNPVTFDRDLHRAVGQTVQDIMTPHPITIHPEQTLAEAARLMRDRHVHRLPVVDETGRLVGIITQSDIVRSMALEMAAV
jgi:CBS domain-containing protein